MNLVVVEVVGPRLVLVLVLLMVLVWLCRTAAVPDWVWHRLWLQLLWLERLLDFVMAWVGEVVMKVLLASWVVLLLALGWLDEALRLEVLQRD